MPIIEKRKEFEKEWEARSDSLYIGPIKPLKTVLALVDNAYKAGNEKHSSDKVYSMLSWIEERWDEDEILQDSLEWADESYGEGTSYHLFDTFHKVRKVVAEDASQSPPSEYTSEEIADLITEIPSRWPKNNWTIKILRHAKLREGSLKV